MLITPALLAEFTEDVLELAPLLRRGGNPDLDVHASYESLQGKWWMYIIFQDGDDQPQLSAIAHVVGKNACSKHLLGQLVALAMVATNADVERQLRSGRYSVESCRVLCAGLMRFFPTHVYVDNRSGTYAPSAAFPRPRSCLGVRSPFPFPCVASWPRVCRPLPRAASLPCVACPLSCA